MRIEYTVAFLYNLIKISAILSCERRAIVDGLHSLHEPVISNLHSRIRDASLFARADVQRPCRQCCLKYVNIENSALRWLCGPTDAGRSMN